MNDTRIKKRSRRDESCEHNRRKYDCKECGGRRVCRHNKLNRFCTKCCSRDKLCKHSRIKLRCVICSDLICEHSRRRNYCAECGGKYVCEHNNNKYRCFDCKHNTIMLGESQQVTPETNLGQSPRNKSILKIRILATARPEKKIENLDYYNIMDLSELDSLL